MKHDRAVKWLWGINNFKRFISQFVKRDNTEEQWCFDYHCFVDQLGEVYEHPIQWAREFYQEDWDEEKAKESLNNLVKK